MLPPKPSFVSLLLLTSLLIGMVTSSARRYDGKRTKRRCEKVEVEQCSSIGYEFTDTKLSPVDVFNQAHAEELIDTYALLLKSGCAKEMELLVCAVYVPICIKSYQEYLPPCRFICERAKAGCLPLFDRYKYEWPDHFNCSNFPELTPDSQMCFHNNDKKTTTTTELDQQTPFTTQHRDSEDPDFTRSGENDTTTIIKTTKSPTEEAETNIKPPITTTTKLVPTITQQVTTTTTTTTEKPTTTTISTTTTSTTTNTTLLSRGCRCQCSPPMVELHDRTHLLYNQISTGSMENCLMSCHSPYFAKSSHQLVVSWLSVWSIACFAVALFTVSTYVIDKERFDYSERPIVYISVCYLFISIGYIIRLVVGHEAISCGKIGTESYSYQHNSASFLCSLIFLLTYFFFMAATLWWVLLSFTWFLLIRFRANGIWKYLRYYHMIVWGVCSVKCIIIFGISGVDGDPLSGICSVGAQDVENLKFFVIVPLVIYLTFTCGFLAVGLCHFFSFKVSLLPTGKKGGEKRLVTSSEKLVERVGLFLLLYLVPTIVLLACYLYEMVNRHTWNVHYNCNLQDCHDNHPDKQNDVIPEVTVFIIKFSATFLIGIGNGVWLFSSPRASTSTCRPCPRRRFRPCGPADDDAESSAAETSPPPIAAAVQAPHHDDAEKESLTSDSDVASYCDVCSCQQQRHPCSSLLTTSGDDDVMMVMTSRSEEEESESTCCCHHHGHPPSLVDEESGSLVVCKLPPKLGFHNSCL